ncbi:MAG: prepilin peptidase, partial [Chloroflexota bacterium]
MSLSLLSELPVGLAGAFAGGAIMGGADHYSRDGTLLPFPVFRARGWAGTVGAFVPLFGPLLSYRCSASRKIGAGLLACVVQIAMAVLWVALARRYGLGWPLLSSLVLTAFLGAIAVIDFRHRLIPSLLVYPTMIIALAGSPLWPGLGLLGSIEGAALGFA